MTSEYIKLLLQREAGTQDKYLIALRATADHYGWTEEFPVWTPEPVGTSGGYTLIRDPGRLGELRCEAGITLRVSEAKTKAGYPKGQVHRFKVSANCGLWDIAEVAHFTKGPWYWMTSPTGTRIVRERWEARYQSKEPQQRRGLVSA